MPTSVHLVVAARRADDRSAVVAALSGGPAWSAEEAANFGAALRRCREPGVSCLLLHIDLPDAGVTEALGVLARDPLAAAVPVVVLSSHLGDDYCLELVAAGADDAIGDDGLRGGGLRRTVAHAIARRGASVSAARRASRTVSPDARLRASETLARLALQCADLGAWERDLQTGRVTWSPECAAIFGVRLEEFSGRYEDFEAFVAPEDRERVRATSAESLRAGSSGCGASLEFRIRRTDGEVRWVVNHGGVVAEADGSGARVVGIIGDITARKRAEGERERLLEAERAARIEADRAGRLKDEFLATISHELRTPLNSILGWVRLLTRAGAKPETFAEGIRVIERNARVQAQLISDLLDVNRIASGKLLLDLGDVDLNEVANSALDTLQSVAQDRRVSIERSATPDLPRVRGDAARLQQVIWNLLSNAIKFTPEGGHVALATRRDGEAVEVEVRDTGQGIDPDFLERMFDPFLQADGSTARRHGGLGLGLAIVKRLVEMHGGTVVASSDGPGRGATFRVRLPSVTARSGTDVAGPVAVERDSLQGVEVLLVDDQPDALEFTRRMLAEHGAEVRTATRAEDALAVLRDTAPDRLPALIVSDIGMPGIDGYELLRTVRLDLGLGPDRLPAIAVTAYAREDDRRDTLAVGYQAHLTKPLQPDRLVASVGALARRGPAPGLPAVG